MFRQRTAINLKYKALHGFYWMLYCLATGFITVFLLAYGYTSSTIGIIAALSNVLAAAGQLLVGNLADRSDKLTWKSLFLIIGGFELLALLILAVFRENAAINGIVFPAFGILMYFQMPLVNSAAFYYTGRGIEINFGSARGMGSVFYALISFAAGQMIVHAGEGCLISFSIVVLLGLLTTVVLLPCEAAEKDTVSGEPEEDSAGTGGGLFSFARRYPEFILLLSGCVLLMAFHNIGHTYMIQIMESVGGNSASMGNAFSIEALMELPVMFGFYRLLKKVSAGNLLTLSGAAFVAKALAYMCAGSVLALYLAQILQMFSYAVFILASVYYADQQMDKRDKVTGQSYMTASFSIGAVLGNLLGGQVLERMGLNALLVFAVALAACGALITTAGVFIKKRSR